MVLILLFVSLPTMVLCSISTSSTQLTVHSFANLINEDRVKRQLMDVAARCVAQCAQDMSQSMGDRFSSVQGGIGTLNADMFDEELLKEFCRAYNAGSSCFDQCQDSTLKRTLQSGFAALEFICVKGNQELQSNVDCYKRSQPLVNATCVPRCGGPEIMHQYQMEQEAAKEDNNLRDIASVMGKMCDYVDCHLTCEVPIRSQSCQSKAAGDWMQKFVSVALKGAKDMLVNVGSPEFFPASCNRLAEGRFTPTKDLQYPQNDGQSTKTTQTNTFYSQNQKSGASKIFENYLASLSISIFVLLIACKY